MDLQCAIAGSLEKSHRHQVFAPSAATSTTKSNSPSKPTTTTEASPSKKQPATSTTTTAATTTTSVKKEAKGEDVKMEVDEVAVDDTKKSPTEVKKESTPSPSSAEVWILYFFSLHTRAIFRKVIEKSWKWNTNAFVPFIIYVRLKVSMI